MSFKPYPILYLFACAAMGILIQNLVYLPTKVLFTCLALLLLATASVWSKRRGRVILGALLITLCAGIRLNQTRESPPPATLCSDPSLRWIAEVDNSLTYEIDQRTQRRLQKTQLALKGQYCNGVWTAKDLRVSATLWGQEPVFRQDRIEVRLAVEDIRPALSPNRPNSLDRARQLNIEKYAKVRSPHALLERGRGLANSLDYLRFQVHQNLYAAFDFEQAAILSALVLGDRGGISANTRDRWAKAGIAHLLAISGLHIGLLTFLIYTGFYLLFSLIAGFGERFSLRKSAALCTILPIVTFCFWTGASLPTVRATLMMLAILLGTLINRPKSALNACGLAGLGLLFYQPLNLFSPGFILSFGSVIGLLLWAPKAISTKNPSFSWLRLSILSTLIASLIVMPLSLKLFYFFNLLSPLSNWLALPLATWLITPLALVFMPLSFFDISLTNLLTQILSSSLSLLDTFALWAAQQKTFHLVITEPNWPTVICFYVILGILFTGKHPRKFWFATTLTLALSVFHWLSTDKDDSNLVIVQPYVGQGDGTLLLLPNKDVIIIDAGGSFEPGGWDPGLSVMAPLLRSYGKTTIDLAVATHPHPDHLNGFLYLSKNFTIKEFWWNGMGQEIPILKEIIKNIKSNGGIIKTQKDIQDHRRGEISLELLHPKSEEKHGYYPGMHLNDNSIVIRFQYGKTSILFTGDIEIDAETHLLNVIKPTDILKVAHHGSRSSSTLDFLTTLAPQLAFISVGRNNRFGLPNHDVIERYGDLGIELKRTDEDGMITLSSDAQQWFVESLNSPPLTITPEEKPLLQKQPHH